MSDLDSEDKDRRHARRWERRAKKYYRALIATRDELDRLAERIDHLLDEMDTPT